MVFFYVNHWIPPVPLALRDGGVHHEGRARRRHLWAHLRTAALVPAVKNDDGPFHDAAGDTVHCFAAVFAPTALQTRIYQHWQYYDGRAQT